MSAYEIPDFSFTPGTGDGTNERIPDFSYNPDTVYGNGDSVKIPDFSFSGDTSPSSGAVTSESLRVIGPRSEADLVIPTQEDPVHKDLEIETGSVTTRLRWDADLGYVAIAEKEGDGSWQAYDQDEFEEVNAGQLDDNGGGPIPPPTTDKPEFYVPPDGDKSLIYRWDPETEKDVIVGYRVDGSRHYFQSRATMDSVNSQAADGGLLAPTRPLSEPSSSIPGGNKFNKDSSGKPVIAQYDEASNGPANADGDKKTYIWRWDSKAGRYCAVAESVDGSPGKFDWYSTDEYGSKNSGPDALSKADPGALYAPGVRTQIVDTEGSDVRFVADDNKDTTGDGKEYFGDPIYVTDPDTGKKVMVGVQVTVDGDTVQYDFDERHMRDYNEQVTRDDGTTYWEAKDSSEWPDGSTPESKEENDLEDTPIVFGGGA